MNNTPYIPGNTNAVTGHKAALSLCIVSNRLDELLYSIVRACAPFMDEILIGYDGPATSIPVSFTGRDNMRVVLLRWEGYSNTKNKLAAMARHSWILSLDGDELPDASLLQEIAGLPFSTMLSQTMCSMKRISFFEGKKILHGAWGRDRIVRLYNKTYTCWDQAVVHEKLSAKDDTRFESLQGTLWHYTADRYDNFLEKNRKYARLSADKYFAAGKKSPLWKRLLSPAFTFWKEYLFQGGFLDGKAGWKVAGINAAYTRWKYKYLWEKYQESAS